MFGDVEVTVHAAAELLKRAPEYDYLIAPEAKSIPLLYEMARQSGAEKYFVARKGPKAYMSETFEVQVKSITTMGVQKLVIDTADADMIRGKRMLIVDDVISTGESLRATEELVNRPAASWPARWPSWPRATPRNATTSSSSPPCPCSTPTAPSRNKRKRQKTRPPFGGRVFYQDPPFPITIDSP